MMNHSHKSEAWRIVQLVRLVEDGRSRAQWVPGLYARFETSGSRKLVGPE